MHPVRYDLNHPILKDSATCFAIQSLFHDGLPTEKLWSDKTESENFAFWGNQPFDVPRAMKPRYLPLQRDSR